MAEANPFGLIFKSVMKRRIMFRMFGPRMLKSWLMPSLCSMLFLASCRKEKLPTPQPPTPPVPPTVNITPPADLGFYFVGYVPSYRDPDAIPDVKFRMCNVINYAFAAVGATGDITIANPARLSIVVDKAKKPFSL